MDPIISKDDPVSDYRRSERQEMLIAPPLDLSYKKSTTLDELATKRIQTARTGKAPLRTPADRFKTSSLWLSNNSLTSMEGLENFTQRILEDPTYLCWLDLSFNEIEEIGNEIIKFPNLKILYLHGNNISNINDVVKLKQLHNLRSLSLHGNPVEHIPWYRGHVVHILPQLSTFDFSPVLAAEKKRVAPVGFYKSIRTIT